MNTTYTYSYIYTHDIHTHIPGGAKGGLELFIVKAQESLHSPQYWFQMDVKKGARFRKYCTESSHSNFLLEISDTPPVLLLIRNYIITVFHQLSLLGLSS